MNAGAMWLRLGSNAVICVILLWISVGSTLNIVLAQQAPAVALRWWPMGAEARTGLAAQLLASGVSRPNIPRVLAARALGRSPALGPAAGVLGLAYSAGGDIRSADRAFAYAERVSRRDLPTELWLIQRRVSQGDVAGALVHYDIALRTNHAAFETLVPILIAASGNAPVRNALLPYLSERVAWANEYAERLLSNGTDPESIFVQLHAMRLNRSRDADHGLLAHAVDRLVALDRPTLALRLIGLRSTAALRDGDFDGSGDFPPLDWWLRNEPGLAATRERSDGENGMALHVVASGEQGGEVAHQLLMLPAGSYRFTGTARAASSGGGESSVSFALTCGAGNAALAATVHALRAKSRFAAEFRVPAGCSAQWLRIVTPPAANVDLWLDDLAVTPAGPTT